MYVSEFIERARSLLDPRDEMGRFKPVPYSHDISSFRPDSVAPPEAGLDCGTFVRWAAKLDVNANNPFQGASNQPWDTTGIALDAIHAQRQRFFKRIDRPYPGCVIVYPDYTAHYKVQGWPGVDVDPLQDGHIAIVTEIGQFKIATHDGPKTLFGATKVIHCSRLIAGMRTEFVPEAKGHSIAETNALPLYTFARIYASINHIEADPVQTANEP